MTSTDLEEAIAAGDPDRCIAGLANLSEPERRTLAPSAIRVHRDAYRRSRASFDLHWKDPERIRIEAGYLAAFLALMGTATLAEIRKAPLWRADERVYDVLAARRPPWLGDWCEWILEERGWPWKVIRRMVREGICARPASPMYILWMLDHSGSRHVREMLLADPGLLEYEIWQLFRIEGTAQLSLTSADKYGDDAWSRVLLELSAAGTLDRARLLDSSLDALECDFHQFRAGWFSRFHEALAPSLEERAARSGRYLRLIGSRIPPTVSFALNALRLLSEQGRVSPEDLLASLPPAYYAKEKGTVNLAIRLAEQAVQARPDLAPAAASSAAGALEHLSAETQSAALNFVARYRGKDRELEERIRMAGSGAAPSVRKKIVQLLGEAPDAAVSAAADSFEPAAAKPEEQKPCQTVEELAQEFSSAIENEGPPDSLERVLDGVSRLCATRPEGFDRLTAPLRKRVEHLLGRESRPWFSGHAVRPLFCGLAKAWLSGEPPGPAPEFRKGLAGFLGARIYELAQRVAARRAHPLLAAPTHRGGTIDPAVLAARLRAVEDPGQLDRVQALARQSTVEREERTIDFTWLHHSYAYEGKVSHHYTGKIVTQPLLPVDAPIDDPWLRAYGTRGDCGIPMLRWAATVLPACRESWYAAGCVAIGDNLDWWSAEWANKVFLEPLAEPGAAPGTMGMLLIVIGLAAKEAGEGTLATDALSGAVGDGRVNKESLGRALARLFSWDHVKMARVMKRLSQVARCSSLHEQVVRDGIAFGLDQTLPAQAEALGVTLDLFYELSIATRAGLTGTLRSRLGAVRGSGRAAAVSRKLLAHCPEST
ncbi:MAG TPA: DUF6493 family protein [Bryobacteraceae bacterium]|nr:DUF6493 family protein [Bryobacteraceae bacterium]